MQFSIGRFRIEVTVTDRRKPWNMGLIAKRRLAGQVAMIAEVQGYGYKIDRIKALREIARDRGWIPDFTLKDTKEWVESAYAENGSGAVL